MPSVAATASYFSFLILIPYLFSPIYPGGPFYQRIKEYNAISSTACLKYMPLTSKTYTTVSARHQENIIMQKKMTFVPVLAASLILGGMATQAFAAPEAQTKPYDNAKDRVVGGDKKVDDFAKVKAIVDPYKKPMQELKNKEFVLKTELEVLQNRGDDKNALKKAEELVKVRDQKRNMMKTMRAELEKAGYANVPLKEIFDKRPFGGPDDWDGRGPRHHDGPGMGGMGPMGPCGPGMGDGMGPCGPGMGGMGMGHMGGHMGPRHDMPYGGCQDSDEYRAKCQAIQDKYAPEMESLSQKIFVKKAELKALRHNSSCDINTISKCAEDYLQLKAQRDALQDKIFQEMAD